MTIRWRLKPKLLVKAHGFSCERFTNGEIIIVSVVAAGSMGDVYKHL